MKKKFTAPEIKTRNFSFECVVTTSGSFTGGMASSTGINGSNITTMNVSNFSLTF